MSAGFALASPADMYACQPGSGRAAYMERSWSARSRQVDFSGFDEERLERLYFQSLSEEIALHTSGTTGEPVAWLRTPRQLWDEAGVIADLVRHRRPEALLSFVPSSHIYGAMATGLLAARLRLPMWYVAPGDTGFPSIGGSRWLVAAIPSAFGALAQLFPADHSHELTVLHSTAILPAAAGDFAAGRHAGQLLLLEVFGSTETGAVAYRAWSDPETDWQLMPDVSFATDLQADPAVTAGEVKLDVTSPRLARQAGEPPPEHRSLDDFVELAGTRAFRFHGRRGRLVKVNGKRVDLDRVEDALGSCGLTDAACVPVRDPVRGEHFDLHVVPALGAAVPYQLIQQKLAPFGTYPRAIKVVDSVSRTETGKARVIAADEY